MIHFEKADVTSKVADLPIANFHLKKIQPAGGDQSFANFDCGRFNFLVAQSVPVAESVLVHHLFWCEGLRPCAGGRPFVSSWSGLEADKTTCMPFAQMILLSN